MSGSPARSVTAAANPPAGGPLSQVSRVPPAQVAASSAGSPTRKRRTRGQPRRAAVGGGHRGAEPGSVAGIAEYRSRGRRVRAGGRRPALDRRDGGDVGGPRQLGYSLHLPVMVWFAAVGLGSVTPLRRSEISRRRR
ncbi:hypothetical protein GCM10007977_095540 [Dactylosporangium sucinum]|uniref:Uncharacterized protein n=1 Tax=Dactylosporangium sucinum TaxID=1424081 RepID=A0A917UCW5_9ACTN|nr:hypothetical protein GCM10007977_095540 [Dactylosporangium sucinum]